MRDYDAGAESIVHVIDDEPTILVSLRGLFESAQLTVFPHSSAERFLGDFHRTYPACVVTDVRMPGMSGQELQRRLLRQAIQIPIIFLTGFADIPMAVKAMDDGAFAFLEKPADPELILSKVKDALARDAEVRLNELERAEFGRRYASLSPRERETIRHLIKGATSKQIAAKLGISAKTVDLHRKNVLRKMGAENPVILASIVEKYRFSETAIVERPEP